VTLLLVVLVVYVILLGLSVVAVCTTVVLAQSVAGAPMTTLYCNAALPWVVETESIIPVQHQCFLYVVLAAVWPLVQFYRVVLFSSLMLCACGAVGCNLCSHF